MHRLKDKVAIVTGSSSGIGKAIALRFGAEGAKVVVTARRMALCEQTVAQITKSGGEAWAIQTDVADERQVERLIDETVKRYGRLDILVNNAGVIAGGRLAETTTKAFDEVMDVNLRGTFFCCRAGFKQMKKQGKGIIINMSSPFPSQSRRSREPLSRSSQTRPPRRRSSARPRPTTASCIRRGSSAAWQSGRAC